MALILNSCKTYTVTPESLKSQFTSESNKLEQVKINNPLSTYQYEEVLANKIQDIAVIDKYGNAFNLTNSPAIEMRVTLKSGKRKNFYFDTVTIEDDTLKGLKSRILGLKSQVPYNQIVKIELQDGGKNYHYVPPTKDEVILKQSDETFELRGELQESFSVKLDTISVDCHLYRNLFYANCTFDNNDSRLRVLYYLNGGKLELIKIFETSPYEDSVFWVREFYLEHEKIFHDKQYGLPKEGNSKVGKYKSYQFNKDLNLAFLKQMSAQLYAEIQKNRQ